MQALRAIRRFCQNAEPMLFAAPDRVTRRMMWARAEQIDTARRYWACPF